MAGYAGMFSRTERDNATETNIGSRAALSSAEAVRPVAGDGAQYVEYDRHRAIHYDPRVDVGAWGAAGDAGVVHSRSDSDTRWNGLE